MPSSLATSGMVAHEASLASAWRSLRTICSRLCPLPIKSPPLTSLGYRPLMVTGPDFGGRVTVGCWTVLFVREGPSRLRAVPTAPVL